MPSRPYPYPPSETSSSTDPYDSSEESEQPPPRHQTNRSDNRHSSRTNRTSHNKRQDERGSSSRSTDPTTANINIYPPNNMFNGQPERRPSRGRKSSNNRGSPFEQNQWFMQPPQNSSGERSRSRSRDPEYEAWKREKEREQAIADFKRQEEERERMEQQRIEEYKLEQDRLKKEEKEKQDAAIAKWKQDQKDKEDERKRVWEEVELERKRKEAEDNDKKKKEEEEYRDKMKRDLTKWGLSENQVDAIVKHDDEKDSETRRRSSSHGKELLRYESNKKPVYIKIKKKDVETETLKFYDLDWEYDREDKDYIIIMHELSERETDILFEHTRRLRSRKVLQIEERKGRDNKPDYAWVRRRSKSRGKSPARESSRERIVEKIVSRK